MKVSLKLKLATLWTSLMFLIIYIDYFALYMPSIIEDILRGRVFVFEPIPDMYDNIIGLAYNHFWWKGLYTGVHVMNAYQTFRNEDKTKITNGYTLFMTYRLGYQVKLFKNRFFIEPSVGLTHWPIITNTPQSFKLIDNKWHKYFGWEPGLHLGYNF